MAEGNCVGCEKHVCSKCDGSVRNRSLKCLVPASENYPGWKKCTIKIILIVLSFKCDKEEHATDY